MPARTATSRTATPPTPPIADYHVHTRFSDGKGEIPACIERAIALGLTEIGFSDHITPSCLAERGYYGIGRARLDDYVAAVRAAAARYPEIRVLLGAEADYIPECAEEVFEILAALPFDYVLGSVHFVDGFEFIESRTRRGAGWRDVDHVYRRYYELVREAACTGRFDVASHLDLPKKWGYRPTEDMTAFEDAALEAIAAAGMAIEINTSGMTDPVGEMYPTQTLLDRAHRAGIGLIVSSDAHAVREIAGWFGEATGLAGRAGYTQLVRLSDRRTMELPITA